MQLEARRRLIIEDFIQGYFGHVLTPKALWGQLESYCDGYLGLKDKEVDIALIQDLESVVTHHPLNKYPVSPAHTYSVLNWLVKYLTSHQVHVPESLLVLQSKYKTSTESEYIYKSFDRTGSGDYVTLLEEHKNIIGHGTTGLTSWQGALFITDWINMSPHIVKGKRVLELGSGCGLLGLTLLKSVTLKSFTFTDCHHNVLNFLLYNLQLNIPPLNYTDHSLEEKQSFLTQGPPVIIKEDMASRTSYHQRISESTDATIKQLDWLNFDPNQFGSPVDVVVGSDIVYERGLLAPLCKVLKWFLIKNTESVAYMACTERSMTTLACFETEMDREQLVYSVIAKGSYSPAENVLCSDVQHQSTRIYEIKLTL